MPRKKKSPVPLELQLHDEEHILRAAVVLMDGRTSQARQWKRVADLLARCQLVIRACRQRDEIGEATFLDRVRNATDAQLVSYLTR